MALRIFCFLVLVFSFSFFPWWLSLAFAIVFIAAFQNFYEALVPAFFFDLMLGFQDFAIPLPFFSWLETQFVFTILILLLLVLVEWLKEKIVISGL